MPEKPLPQTLGNARWYHAFELAPGLRTPGRVPVDAAQVLDRRFLLPKSLAGLRALDIGTMDGPYAFELERRGAEVTATDVHDPSATGFSTAREILGSRVRYVRTNAYDLVRELGGERFDLILFLGVYYHLKHPLLALEQIRGVLRDGGRLCLEGECLPDHAPPGASGWRARWRRLTLAARIGRSDMPAAAFYSGTYKDDPSVWFVPNAACLREWLSAAGLRLECHEVRKSPRGQRFFGTARKAEGGVPAEYGIW